MTELSPSHSPDPRLHDDPWLNSLACSHFTLEQNFPDGWLATDGCGEEIPGTRQPSLAECLGVVRDMLPHAAHGGTIFGARRGQ